MVHIANHASRPSDKDSTRSFDRDETNHLWHSICVPHQFVSNTGLIKWQLHLKTRTKRSLRRLARR